MASVALKHALIVCCVIFCPGKLTTASRFGCLFSREPCAEGEICDKSFFFGRCLSSSDYVYGTRKQRSRYPGDGSFFADGERRDRTYEPTLEDQRLIKSLPIESEDDGRDTNHDPLPPIQITNIHEDYNSGYTDQFRSQDYNAFRNQDSRSNEFKYSSWNHDQEFPSHDVSSPQNEDPDSVFPQQQSVLKDENPMDGKSNFPASIQRDSEMDVSEEKTASMGQGKVLVKGEVRQVSADIDQGSNPEPEYDKVKDFFQSQLGGSIVEVPETVQRDESRKRNMEKSKHHFIPVGASPDADEVEKEQEDESRDLALDGELGNSDMVQTGYTAESPEVLVKRVKKEPAVQSKGAHHQRDSREFTNTVVNQQPKYFIITLVVVGCVTGVVLCAIAVYLVMKRYQETKAFKPVTLPGQEAAADYQELCRQLRASQGWDSGPVKPLAGQTEKERGLSSRAPKYSWSEEPVVPNMDISTGHVVLAYMEDHLKNKDRLNQEWEALKTYEAEPNSTEVGKMEKNARKNRYSDVLPYDHTRIVLKENFNATGSDYINASAITDHDPKNPAYVATQGPLVHTVADFWQMIWEQGVVVIVNLTKLSDLGLPQCHRYWPEEGHENYHIYEVHLVSEHIWCEDYLVRSFYLKNLQTSETRTVTQFHFLSWPDLNVPTTPKPLLEFRRKVNKCFRGRSSPVVVHCSGGVGRTGTYVLIDMVLNKMTRGAKEIDIAATLEHLRDQRPSMVKTKAQFEFALTAVAEEVNAILQALAK